MKNDLGSNLKRLRNVFVDAVQKTADSAMQCSKGVFLSYDIQKTCSHKQRISRDIGERVTLLIKEGTPDVSKDVTLAQLISELNSVETELEERKKQKETLGNPFKRVKQ